MNYSRYEYKTYIKDLLRNLLYSFSQYNDNKIRNTFVG